MIIKPHLRYFTAVSFENYRTLFSSHHLCFTFLSSILIFIYVLLEMGLIKWHGMTQAQKDQGI